MTAATLRDWLENAIAADERNPEHFRGNDWWQLSGEEEAVFAIDPDRFPRMVKLWHCYEAFKGIVDEGFPDDLIEQARREHPEWRGQPPDISQTEFSAFAKEYGGLSFREAHAMFAKHDFWGVREGVSRYHDE